MSVTLDTYGHLMEGADAAAAKAIATVFGLHRGSDVNGDPARDAPIGSRMETLPLLLKVIAMLSIVLVGPILGLMAISGVIKVFYDWLGQERQIQF